jgi:PKD repeat protein
VRKFIFFIFENLNLGKQKPMQQSKKTLSLLHFSFLIMFFILAFVSCKKKETSKETQTETPPAPDPNPVCCFNPSFQFIQINEVVNFFNCSSNYDRVEWNFGDGGSATISEPSHKFEKKGIFDVVLKAFKGSVSTTVSKKVVVGEKAGFTLYTHFSPWDYMGKYSGFQSYALLYRTSDPTSGYYMNGNVATISDPATFRVKIMVIGSYTVASTDPNCPTCIVFKSERVDSAMTDDIDAFTGPKTPTASVKLKPAELTYTISGISFF